MFGAIQICRGIERQDEDLVLLTVFSEEAHALTN